MVIDFNCPSCGKPVSPNQRYCENCGVDVAVAALLAEQQAMLPIRIPQGMPISPEVLVPRIGDYLIEKGLLSTEQLQKALAFQKKWSAEPPAWERPNLGIHSLTDPEACFSPEVDSGEPHRCTR